MQIQNAISQFIFEMLEKFFQLSTSLEYFYQKRYEILGDSKVLNLLMDDVSKCDVII